MQRSHQNIRTHVQCWQLTAPFIFKKGSPLKCFFFFCWIQLVFFARISRKGHKRTYSTRMGKNKSVAGVEHRFCICMHTNLAQELQIYVLFIFQLDFFVLFACAYYKMLAARLRVRTSYHIYVALILCGKVDVCGWKHRAVCVWECVYKVKCVHKLHDMFLSNFLHIRAVCGKKPS